jgi:hypothetical protein
MKRHKNCLRFSSFFSFLTHIKYFYSSDFELTGFIDQDTLSWTFCIAAGRMRRDGCGLPGDSIVIFRIS